MTRMGGTRMLLTAVAALLLSAAPAQAATFRVVTTTDSTEGCSGTDCPSIRSALAAAAVSNGPDTIVVPAGEYQLGSDQLLAGSPVNIVGDGARRTTIRGNVNVFRVLEVPVNVEVTVTGVTLADGHALPRSAGDTFYAGGIVKNSGTLTLDRVRITERSRVERRRHREHRRHAHHRAQPDRPQRGGHRRRRRRRTVELRRRDARRPQLDDRCEHRGAGRRPQYLGRTEHDLAAARHGDRQPGRLPRRAQSRQRRRGHPAAAELDHRRQHGRLRWRQLRGARRDARLQRLEHDRVRPHVRHGPPGRRRAPGRGARESRWRDRRVAGRRGLARREPDPVVRRHRSARRDTAAGRGLRFRRVRACPAPNHEQSAGSSPTTCTSCSSSQTTTSRERHSSVAITSPADPPGEFISCTSGHTLRDLTEGVHVFQVRAVRRRRP